MDAPDRSTDPVCVRGGGHARAELREIVAVDKAVVEADLFWG